MPAHGLARTRGVRWRPDTGVELWCATCDTFWPADNEFWNFGVTLQRCRACHNTKKAKMEQQRRRDNSATIRAANAAYYQENQPLLRLKDNQRKAARRLAVTSAALITTLTALIAA